MKGSSFEEAKRIEVSCEGSLLCGRRRGVKSSAFLDFPSPDRD